MGSAPTRPVEEYPVPPWMPTDHNEVAVRSGAMFRDYVESCAQFRGVVLARQTAELFSKTVSSTLPQLRRELHAVRRAAELPPTDGHHPRRPSFARNGVFFHVFASDADAKRFSQHMRGLELLSFLGLPSVVVPRSAMVADGPQVIGCVSIHHLHARVPPPHAGTSAHHASIHVATVRAVLSKVLRIRGDPAVELYETGDGQLVPVDASALLPPLALRPSPGYGKPLHQARPELLLVRDAVVPPAMPLSATSVTPRTPGEGTPPPLTNERHHHRGRALPALHAVINATLFTSSSSASSPAGFHDQQLLPYLHAVVASHPVPTTVLDESIKVVGIVTAAAIGPSSSEDALSDEAGGGDASCWLAATLAGSAGLTRGLLQPAVHDVVQHLSTAAGDRVHVTEVCHAHGVGMHMLGVVWNALGSGHAAPNARRHVAVEMVARASKQWLRKKWRSADWYPGDPGGLMPAGDSTPSTPGNAPPYALDLYRSVHDADFLTSELAPILIDRYGRLTTAIAPVDLPFQPLHSRMEEVLGVSVRHGAVAQVVPRIRVARSEFPFTANDELALATVAVRRDDPIGVAQVLAASALHARSTQRVAGVVQQLRSRRLDNAVLLLFVTSLELMMADVCLRRGESRAAAEKLTAAFASSIRACNLSTSSTGGRRGVAANRRHDALFVTRYGLRLVALLRSLGDVVDANATTMKLLELGALRDLSHVGALAGRQLVEEYYRAAADAFVHHREEGLVVAQAWARHCGALFGPVSPPQCKAMKLLLVAMVKNRRHGEARAVARRYMDLAVRTYGPLEIHTAMATNDVAALTWRRDPRHGLELYQRALDGFRRVPTGASLVAPTLYNMGLAAVKLNRLRRAAGYFVSCEAAATRAQDQRTLLMCQRMNRAVIDMAATKLQRWVRDCMYGVAPSQTSRTDLCSTMTWSDTEEDASTAGEILREPRAGGDDDQSSSQYSDGHAATDGGLFDG